GSDASFFTCRCGADFPVELVGLSWGQALVGDGVDDGATGQGQDLIVGAIHRNGGPNRGIIRIGRAGLVVAKQISEEWVVVDLAATSGGYVTTSEPLPVRGNSCVEGQIGGGCPERP